MEKEEEIIQRCLDGDEEAFNQLVEAYKERVYWVAYGNVGDKEVARDIAQESFVRVYTSFHQFDPDRNFYTWLYTIVRNLCIDWLRKHGDRETVSLDFMSLQSEHRHPDQEASRREREQDVHRVLKEIPEKYRMVLTLRYMEDMNCKEIAEVVDCAHGTARWRLHRAKKLFKEAWEERFSHPPEPAALF